MSFLNKPRKKPLWMQKQKGPPEQLAMFMRAGDIRANYDALSGDRRPVNEDRSPLSDEEFWGGKETGFRETSDEVYSRKLTQSKQQPDQTIPGNWPTSKYDAIKEGGVQYPVHLSIQFGPHGSKFDWSRRMGEKSTGRREVLGGLHRVAAQNDINPDAEVPVLHHEDFQEIEQHGQSREGWRFR